MRLVHYSKCDMLVPEPRDQQVGSKPHGLWLSDEDDYGWSQWCEAESFRDTSAENAFLVELADEANVVYLNTARRVRWFHGRFASGPQYSWHLDWPAVAREYQGIIISPYQWELRLSDVDWYYTWDCASGCIWDPAAIASVTPLGLGAVRDAQA